MLYKFEPQVRVKCEKKKKTELYDKGEHGVSKPKRSLKDKWLIPVMAIESQMDRKNEWHFFACGEGITV